MAQVTITQLPQAAALTGAESVPIVQNGQTVQTTTSAIAGAGALNYPFLTVSQTAGLTQSRYLSTNSGLTLTDNGIQNTLQVNLVGAAMSLNSSGTGIQVKTAPNTVTAREIAVGTGLSVSNADGVSGNPTVSLGTLLSGLVSQTGTGILVLQSGAPAKVEIEGTTSQISIANGNGAANPVVSLANNPIFPGTGSATVPNGTSGQRTGSTGAFRYNTSLQQFEGYTNTGWNQFSLTGGVTSFSAGTTGFSPNTDTTGAVTLDGILNPAHGGTGIDNGTYTITLGGNVTTGGTFTTAGTFSTAGNFATSGANSLTLTTTGVTNVTLPTSGTLATLSGTETFTNKTMSGASNTFTNIGNASLTNSSVTYNGVTVALGSSGTITASTTNPLTVGTGLQLNSGTTFDGSAARTISIDSTVATLTGTQTLTNKTISGTTNTLTNIGNASLTNSTVTIGTTSIALGASSLTLGGLTSVALTQDPVSALQAATKQYVDGLVSSGITYHSPVKYEVPDTTGNLNATYNQPGGAGNGVGATLTNAGALVAFTPDGTVASVGDRILVYNQTNQFENGVYTVTVVGNGATAWVLTRATDADTYALKSPTGLGNGDAFFITSGSTGAGETYVCNTVGVIVFGTTAITFAQISASQVYSAGTGLTLTGTTFSLTNPVVTGLGGTGLASYTAGDMLYYSTGTALSKLGIGASTYIMTSSGAAPQWSNPTGVTVGTASNLAGGATGSLPYQSAANTTTFLALGTTNYVLTAGASAPQYVAQSTLSVGSATNATNTTNTAITADSTNATNYLTFVSATSGNLPQLVNSSITCNPSTGQMTGGIAGGAF
jgi:hypothetical protein